MVDRDIVIEKVKSIQQCLKRIRDVTHFDPISLDNIDVQDIFVINLQRAVQSAIDLATHIVADEGLGIPENLKENFIFLEKAKIITSEQAGKMMKMVGFRNIAVHEYQMIDVEMLKSILTGHLKDVEDFYSSIIRYYKIQTK